MRHYKILSILVLSFLILSIACSKSDDDSSTSEITYNQSQTEDINQEDSSEGTEDDQSGNDNSFDRVKMMTFITEEIIIPSYNNLNTSLTDGICKSLCKTLAMIQTPPRRRKYKRRSNSKVFKIKMERQIRLLIFHPKKWCEQNQDCK